MLTLALTLLILVEFVVQVVATLLNQKSLKPTVPREFEGVYDAAKYETSIRYQKEKSKLSLLQRVVSTLLVLALIWARGFEAIDHLSTSFGWGTIGTGLAFAAIYSLVRMMVGLPFTVYDTFSVEQRYGFNKTSPKTFIGDLVKGLILGTLLGGLAFATLIWFFEKTGAHAWIYSWIALTLFQIFLLFVAPVVILPLFNKFKPIAEGPLKQAVEAYAQQEKFSLQGVFTMDASKRSTKSNAFFTGFGKFRRLVLFDTLMERQTTSELMAVVAHEVGHFKRQHIPKGIALSIVSSGVMLYVLSLLLNQPPLFEAFRMSTPTVYASIILLMVLYSPISTSVSILTNLLSRHFEFEADEFSIATYHKPDELISALKKLSTESFSHLSPHPLRVLLDYSHPPILHRIRFIEQLKTHRA